MNITIYCDGAVKGNGKDPENGGCMGAGAVLLHLSESGEVLHQKELSWTIQEDINTNNRAELLSVKNALTEGIKEDLKHRIDLTVVSDSQWTLYAIRGLWSIAHHIDLILEIRKILKGFKSVKFEWIKGHTNENIHHTRADQLAFAAARREKE